jgi:predicted alpha/beta-fold hydrolase
MSSQKLVLKALLLGLTFFSQFAFSQSAEFEIQTHSQNTVIVNPYKYPIQNPYLATLSYIAARPTKNLRFKTLNIDLHPERAQIPYYGDSHAIDLAFFKQENNPEAPLIFIVPGLGGAALRPSTLAMAELLFNAGFQVITLPSSLSWQFAISVSRTGYPGFSPIDAEDMLELMREADLAARKTHKIKPSKYMLMGFSLGSMDSAFIASHDLQKKYFNFERVLMINPPLQKEKSINTLDGLLIAGTNFSSARQMGLLKFAASKLLDASLFSIEKLLSFNFENQIGLADPELEFIIGTNFRKSLREVILVSQEINDIGILKISKNPFLRSLRKAEAFTFSFRSYINHFLFPQIAESKFYARPVHSPSDLIEESDMRNQLEILTKHDVHWAIFHNENDFIFHSGDLNWLMNTHSDSRIYPRGGHLGNLWFDHNRKDIVNFVLKSKH